MYLTRENQLESKEVQLRVAVGSYLPIFIERILLPVIVFVATTVIVLNPMKLDITQRVTLGLAVVFLGYFIGHTVYKKPNVSASEEPFAVAIEGSIIRSTKALGTGPYVMVDWLPKTTRLAAIDYMPHLKITNKQNRVSVIRSYTLEMLRVDGTWERLINIQLGEMAAKLHFIHPDPKQSYLTKMHDVTILNDRLANNFAIPSGGTVSGFAFLAFPREHREVVRPYLRLRITVTDEGGARIVKELSGTESRDEDALFPGTNSVRFGERMPFELSELMFYSEYQNR